MTCCPRKPRLDALVQDEVSLRDAHELREHAEGCAMCRHELRWLEVEATLFRQRAGRDEVQRLWKGVAEAAGPEKASPGGSSAKPLAQLAGLAVALMLVVAIGRWKPWQGTPVEDSLGDVLEEVLESQAPQSEASWSGMSSAVQAPCSRLPDDLGFVCGPVSADRLLASR